MQLFLKIWEQNSKEELYELRHFIDFFLFFVCLFESLYHYKHFVKELKRIHWGYLCLKFEIDKY